MINRCMRASLSPSLVESLTSAVGLVEIRDGERGVMLMDLHKVRIEGGSYGVTTNIYLDGKPLKGVTEIKFISDAEEQNQVAITFIPSEVEIDVHALVNKMTDEVELNGKEGEAD